MPAQTGKICRSRPAKVSAPERQYLPLSLYKNTHLRILILIIPQFQNAFFSKRECGDANALETILMGSILTPMELLMNVPQTLVGDVGVDLGRGDVFMPQKLLDTSQVGAAGQKVGRVGMAQGVGRHLL